MDSRNVYTLPEEEITYQDLLDFIAQCQGAGEDERVIWEFKEKITSPERFAATLIAFANTFGGVLIVGVKGTGNSTSPWKAVGAGEEDRNTQRLFSIASKRIRPLLDVRIVERTSPQEPSGALVMCRVERSDVAPHEDILARRIYVRQGDANEGMDLRTIESLLDKRNSPEPKVSTVGTWGIDRSKARVVYAFRPHFVLGRQRLFRSFEEKLQQWVSNVVGYDVDSPRAERHSCVLEWSVPAREPLNRLLQPSGKLTVDEGMGLRFYADWDGPIHVYRALHYLLGCLNVYSRALREFRQFPHFMVHTDWNLRVSAQGSSPITADLWPGVSGNLVHRMTWNAAQPSFKRGYFEYCVDPVSPHDAGQEAGRQQIAEELLYELARYCGVSPDRGELVKAAEIAGRPPGWNVTE